MNQSSDDRVIELELVLRDLLDCFAQGPEGIEVEITNPEGLAFVGEDLVEAVERATDVLEREE
jgi:hypothetical protein